MASKCERCYGVWFHSEERDGIRFLACDICGYPGDIEPSYTEEVLESTSRELRAELEKVEGEALGILTQAIQLLTQTRIILQQERRRRWQKQREEMS